VFAIEKKPQRFTPGLVAPWSPFAFWTRVLVLPTDLAFALYQQMACTWERVHRSLQCQEKISTATADGPRKPRGK
jgi:hypothetical protein